MSSPLFSWAGPPPPAAILRRGDSVNERDFDRVRGADVDRSWRGGTSPIFKAAIHQTKAAMDRKALSATQLNEENKKVTIVKYVPLYCFCKKN